jgi:hypothetical protein
VTTSSFAIHWSLVQSAPAALNVRDGFRLVALWPSPVDHDACFRDAGFTEFADNDDAWAVRADELLDRLLAELAVHGEPRLATQAIQRPAPWFLRLFRRPKDVCLREQISLAIRWDSLPACVVAFGSGGVTLHAGNGHHIFWLTLPPDDQLDVDVFMNRVGGNDRLVRTSLRWEFLLRAQA